MAISETTKNKILALAKHYEMKDKSLSKSEAYNKALRAIEKKTKGNWRKK